MTLRPQATDDSSGLALLYPSLYATHGDQQAVIHQAQRSSEEKLQEITALRTWIGNTLAHRLVACAQAMAAAFHAHGKLLIFGNGGSATDAHAVAQMFLDPSVGQPLPAMSLTNDSAVLTALANDVGFDVVFARQVAAFGVAGDIALGISTSGNSGNVIRALEEARRRRLLTIGLAGYDGGTMAETAAIDYLFVIPSSSVHRIQEAYTTVYTVLWELIQEALTGQEHGG